MPCKANEPSRHKVRRARYKVANWPDDDRALQQPPARERDTTGSFQC